MVAVYSIVANLLGIRRNSPDLLLSARHALWAMCAMVTVAVAALWTGLLTSDFSLEYVASYSSVTLPIQYKFAALWGGQQGSLLFWTWLLSIFTSIAIFQNRRRNPEITPWALIVLAGVAIFFLGMLNFVTRPFDLLATVPPDGSDLNPLLQNYWMAIHPPSLYTGYVSATVPFAFGGGALITGKLDDGWIRTTRRWAIFSWFFLTLGNMFGARWAYEVLGWGGYWAWDPVENAAFMPWLVMTAYLHSVMIQERKDMLKVWNLALIGLAFVLTLFGTLHHAQRRHFVGPFVYPIGAWAVLPDLPDRGGPRLHGAAGEPREGFEKPGRIRIVSLARGRVSVQQPDAGRNRVRGFLGHALSGAVGGGARGQDHRRAALLQQGQRTARARPDLPDGRGAADRVAADLAADPAANFPGAAYDGRGRGHNRFRDGPAANGTC